MRETPISLKKLNLGLEVAGREGKVFVLLLSSDLPNPFFQLISLKNQALEERVSQYLSKAREARGIGAASTLTGEVLLLGFCEASTFETIRAAGRANIGPESQRNLKLNIRRKFPEATPRFGFRHSFSRGLEILFAPNLEGLEEILVIASELQKLKVVKL